MEKVRYSHFRDGEWGLTVARVFDRDSKTVKFGWAGNVPPRRYDTVEANGNVVSKKTKGDLFCKRVGRAMALGRLESKPIVVKLDGDTLPIVACLEAMEENEHLPMNVQYLARLALDEQINCYTYGELKMRLSDTGSANEKVPNSFLDRMMQWIRG